MGWEGVRHVRWDDKSNVYFLDLKVSHVDTVCLIVIHLAWCWVCLDGWLLLHHALVWSVVCWVDGTGVAVSHGLAGGSATILFTVVYPPPHA